MSDIAYPEALTVPHVNSMQNAFATPSTILLPTVRTLNGASSPHETASQWIGQSGLDLIALDDDIELHGFQLYAVEKW